MEGTTSLRRTCESGFEWDYFATFHRFTCVISIFGWLSCLWFFVWFGCCVLLFGCLFGLLPPWTRSFISFELCANSMQS